MWIDRFVRLLLPRQDHFFVLLDELSAKMTASAAVFRELTTATSHLQFAEIAARLKPLETEADAICHRIYKELDKTFVTPIDREDIAHLTSALDDVIDSMEHAGAFAALFRFDTLTGSMKQLIELQIRAIHELANAVRQLRKFSNPESIREPTVAVHTLENEADLIYRQAIEALFSDTVDARELVRQKDMLYTLEDGVDQCEDAMDVIRSVVVKNG